MRINGNSPLISVIIPVFNAEAFLAECLDSILAQDDTDWEAIVVDDGSTDGSPQICDAYAQRDARIRVFHQKNGGVSRARNLGVEHAKGAWITYIDADDRIPRGYFPPHLASSRADMVLTNVKTFPGEEDLGWIPPGFVDKAHYRTFIRAYAEKGVLMAPWGKFIRREIIVGNGISFNPRFSLGEDTLFDIQLMSLCSTVEVWDSYYLYRYVSRDKWAKHYHYTPAESLDYFRFAIAYYDRLGVSAPDLVRCIYDGIVLATDFSGLSRFRWNLQAEVVGMKRRMLPLVGKRGKVEYAFYALCSWPGLGRIKL